MALPDGFPEPPLIIYGKVLAGVGANSSQIYAGTTKWTITPPTGQGSPIEVSASLKNLGNGAYSYRIEIPVSKAPATTFQLLSDTIPATTTAKTYTLSATVNDQPATLVIPTNVPHAGTTDFQETFRGKTERIDLRFTGSTDDTDGDGMPDWWEALYAPATDPNNSNDPLGDPDGDGQTNIAEYTSGTDPTCLEYAKWLTQHSLSNSPSINKPEDDPDGDGIRNVMEYALGGDPRTPDAAQIRNAVQLKVEGTGQYSYISLSVTKPAGRHCNAEYIVQASGDLSVWTSQEGADVVTLLNSASLLQVRDAGLISATTGRRFLRLKVVPK